MKREYLSKLEAYKELIPVNPNSPKQCSEWLGVDSTAAEVLGVMSLEGDDRAEHLIQARKYDKGLMFLNKYNRKRVRGFHNACGARTSRMTCDGGNRYFVENIQNTPKAIAKCIEAPPGQTFVYKDYSGLELRIAVAYIGEPTMQKLMVNGEDMHAHTGCILFNATLETLTKEQRFIAKIFNFGTIYGAGLVVLQGLLRSQGQINVSIPDVREFRTKWLDHYDYFKEWHSMHKKHFDIYGYLDIETGLGRTIRATRLTDSFNFPIQGTAAEITKLAVHYLHTRYGVDPQVVNVVHDSIGLLQSEELADLWIDRLNECMIESWYYVIKDFAIPNIPMPAQAQQSKTWVFE